MCQFHNFPKIRSGSKRTRPQCQKRFIFPNYFRCTLFFRRQKHWSTQLERPYARYDLFIAPSPKSGGGGGDHPPLRQTYRACGGEPPACIVHKPYVQAFVSIPSLMPCRKNTPFKLVFAQEKIGNVQFWTFLPSARCSLFDFLTIFGSTVSCVKWWFEDDNRMIWEFKVHALFNGTHRHCTSISF